MFPFLMVFLDGWGEDGEGLPSFCLGLVAIWVARTRRAGPDGQRHSACGRPEQDVFWQQLHWVGTAPVAPGLAASDSGAGAV